MNIPVGGESFHFKEGGMVFDFIYDYYTYNVLLFHFLRLAYWKQICYRNCKYIWNSIVSLY